MSLSTQEQVVNVVICTVIVAGLLSGTGGLLYVLFTNPFIWLALVLPLVFLVALLKDDD